MIVCKNSCYLKNYPGGKSTLNLGYFTMEDLSNLVTKVGEQVINNSDVDKLRGPAFNDNSIGDLKDVPVPVEPYGDESNMSR